MQQSDGLARALATDAEIQPIELAFSALDPKIRHDMQMHLRTIQARRHKAIDVITRDLIHALLPGDLIAILRNSRRIYPSNYVQRWAGE